MSVRDTENEGCFLPYHAILGPAIPVAVNHSIFYAVEKRLHILGYELNLVLFV